MSVGTAPCAVTSVPWARMGTRLAGGFTPSLIQALRSVSSARIGMPACIGFCGSDIAGTPFFITSAASAKCGVPVIM